MYLCFTLTDLDGELVPYASSFIENEKPIDGMICFDVEGRILKAHRVMNDTGDYHLDLHEGWLNIPTYKFNQQKFNAGKDPFELNDAYQSKRIKHYVRRERINTEINIDIDVQTELKKHRKVLKAILTALPQLAKLPEVAEFFELSITIENKVAKHAKTAEYIDAIDLRKETGIQEDIEGEE